MKYRPYENPTEMKYDFYQRMWEKDYTGDQAEWNPMCNPIIWIRGKKGDEYMVIGFVEDGIIFDTPYITTWDMLLKSYTYLDGSPVGKEIEE